MSPPDTVRFGRILLSFFNPSFAYAIQPGSENSKKKIFLISNENELEMLLRKMK